MLDSNSETRDVVASVVEALGFDVLEVDQGVVSGRRHVHLVVHRSSGVSIDDCAEIHKTLRPRLEVLLNERDIALQVASPGMDRAIKSDIEYSIFVGRGIRVLRRSDEEWTAGIVESTTEAEVVIASGETIHHIPFEDIQKANLDYSQEVR